jgi:hypothetical protein
MGNLAKPVPVRVVFNRRAERDAAIAFDFSGVFCDFGKINFNG